ncbi:sulfotransferase [Labrenzia sp. 011]|uniref:tetratricopeptide repeat-containing sulfotransferase family protein n=1 Tax=Labrenzia sp. 011 TaxID=2171494 RepID=UPI000D5183D7|nr:sulfotransferase [Labrenzia sp. 011]PVB60295.1 hypothetical protein DCO57_17740 [Labrenzia sp. 011]
MQPNSVEHAFSLIAARNFNEALPMLLDLDDQAPGNPRINYGLGVSYLFFGQAELAVPHLAVAAKEVKKEAPVFTTLASALNISGRNEEALPHARRGIALDARSEYAHRVLGDVYTDLRRPVMARQSFEQALKLDPQSVRAHLGLYELETTLGNTDAAESHIATAFGMAPDDPLVLIAAARSGDAAFRDKVLARIEPILATVPAGAAIPDITRLAFAAGRIHDSRGDTATAFRYYDGYRTGLYGKYDPAQQSWFVNTCKTVFSRAFFDARKNFALSSDRPVFVVGMPRSGTTLVEQIIARHPDAAGAGEMPFFPDRIREISRGRPHTPAFFEWALRLDKREAQRIGRKYLSLLEGQDRKARRIVDKMPHNFEHLWLLALLFPNAHFVHMTRSPADTCLSVYTTPLSAHHGYNIDQVSLGHYYGRYLELMRHWSNVLPVDIRQQSYEALVNGQEAESRALLDHAGLNWHAGCLTPPGADTQVFTFSREQVRQPVYASSIGRWKTYQDRIQPLLEALGEAGE